MAWGPVHYSLQVSEDGNQFSTVAFEPQRADGSPIPLRRRLVLLGPGHVMRSIRLVIHGATDGGGIESADAVPVVREISAYRADDPRPVMPQPWILSVNSNPKPVNCVVNSMARSPTMPFMQSFFNARFGLLMPDLRSDDRYARSLDDQGAWHDAAPSDHAGQVLESIEGDDPELDTRFLAESSPPPIAALSGSNDWDYSDTTGPDPEHPKRWLWDPVRDALSGGMGNLGAAVRHRLAPFLGFCGGAQILGLLESIPDGVDGRNDRAYRFHITACGGASHSRIRVHGRRGARWPDDPHSDPCKSRIRIRRTSICRCMERP